MILLCTTTYNRFKSAYSSDLISSIPHLHKEDLIVSIQTSSFNKISTLVHGSAGTSLSESSPSQAIFIFKTSALYHIQENHTSTLETLFNIKFKIGQLLVKSYREDRSTVDFNISLNCRSTD